MTCCCLLCLYLSPCLFPCLLSGRMTMLQAFLRQLSQHLSFPCFHPFVKNSFPREVHAGSFVVPLHGFCSRTNIPFFFLLYSWITFLRSNASPAFAKTALCVASVHAEAFFRTALKPAQGRFRPCPGDCRRDCERCCYFRFLFLQPSDHGRLLAVPFRKGRSAFTV